MADLNAIREGLAENLRAVPNVNVSAYMLPQLLLPSIEVFPDKFFYDREALYTDEMTFHVRALVSYTVDVAGQQLLDSMLVPSGASSVKQALESDPQLAGLVDDLRVEQSGGYRRYPVEDGQGGGHVLGCEWTVCVFATR